MKKVDSFCIHSVHNPSTNVTVKRHIVFKTEEELMQSVNRYYNLGCNVVYEVRGSLHSRWSKEAVDFINIGVGV